MWQRFTERARRVVFFAQEEAGRLGENYVSTEHLLLGLVRKMTAWPREYWTVWGFRSAVFAVKSSGKSRGAMDGLVRICS